MSHIRKLYASETRRLSSKKTFHCTFSFLFQFRILIEKPSFGFDGTNFKKTFCYRCSHVVNKNFMIPLGKKASRENLMSLRDFNMQLI